MQRKADPKYPTILNMNIFATTAASLLPSHGVHDGCLHLLGRLHVQRVLVVVLARPQLFQLGLEPLEGAVFVDVDEDDDGDDDAEAGEDESADGASDDGGEVYARALRPLAPCAVPQLPVLGHHQAARGISGWKFNGFRNSDKFPLRHSIQREVSILILTLQVESCELTQAWMRISLSRNSEFRPII